MEVILMIVLLGAGLLATVAGGLWLAGILAIEVFVSMFTVGARINGKSVFGKEYAQCAMLLLLGVPAMLFSVARLGWLAH